MTQTMAARFVRSGDVIDGHKVIDHQRYLTAFVGQTIEFRFDTRAPLTVRANAVIEVERELDKLDS